MARTGEGSVAKSPNMIPLSIVIATFNRSAYLLRTLESLAGQTLPAQEFEILVVNNNSTDDTPAVFAEFARRHPELRLRMVAEPDQGISYARNRGVAEAEGECIVFIDDDEEAVPDFAKSYRDFFRSRPDCDAAGGAVVPVYEAPLPRWYSHYIEKMITGAMDMGDRVRPFRGSRYPGVGNSGFRRKLFERYGNFNTALGRSGSNPLGGEEKDFFMRMRSQGIRYYFVPGAAIRHITPASKLSEEYFERLTRMIGVSERIRTLGEGKSSFRRRLLAEAVKWGGTLVLATGYALRGQAIKGRYRIRMRRNITQGLLRGMPPAERDA